MNIRRDIIDLWHDWLKASLKEKIGVPLLLCGFFGLAGFLVAGVCWTILTILTTPLPWFVKAFAASGLAFVIGLLLVKD